MGYEIDFLPVGKESRGGDAIALRYGNLYGSRREQTVIVIDGGYTEDGEALVHHINKYYSTNSVDIVVSTHPDQDHITGLEVVLQEMHVGQLFMHLPWKHSTSLARAKEVSFRTSTLSTRLKDSLQGAASLERIAREQGVSITEPFAGVSTADGVFRVLGPTEEYYRELLVEIVTSDAKQEGKASLADLLRKLATSAASEDLHTETLSEDGETSPRNNTSAICLLSHEGYKALLTGDAGVPALDSATDVLQLEGLQSGPLNFVQVPHHGSRRNVSPSILDRLLGDKGVVSKRGTAFVSSPKKNPENKHPAKKVTNAFFRRGYPVHATQGSTKWHHNDAPARSNFSTSIPIQLHEQVDDHEEA